MIAILVTAVDFAMSSFSLAHNYTEEEGEFNLKQWKDKYITEKELQENKFPYNPSLLVDGKISAFDYLKYHLGYQLVASNLMIKDGKASFMITNYGFACPYGYEMKVYVDGKPVETKEKYSYTDLTQFGQKIYTVPYGGGRLEIQFVNSRDGEDCIKLFNDVEYAGGRNVICQG